MSFYEQVQKTLSEAESSVEREGLVPDPVPTQIVLTNKDADRIARLHSLLRDEMIGEVAKAFDEIPANNPWRKRSVQEFICSQQVLDLEDAINDFCLQVINGKDEATRAEAFAKVEQGAKYYRDLIIHKIRKK